MLNLNLKKQALQARKPGIPRVPVKPVAPAPITRDENDSYLKPGQPDVDDTIGKKSTSPNQARPGSNGKQYMPLVKDKTRKSPKPITLPKANPPAATGKLTPLPKAVPTPKSVPDVPRRSGGGPTQVMSGKKGALIRRLGR